MSILGILGILFVGLKLAGVIAWSWIWVLAPFWVAILIPVVAIIGATAIGLFLDQGRAR